MTVTNTNFLHPTDFKLIIDRKRLPTLEYFVQSVDHPGVSMPFSPGYYAHVSEVPLPGDKLEFSEVTFNIVLDEDMAAYTEIFEWMKRIVLEPYVPWTAKTVDTPTSECDVSLLILNSSNNKQKTFIYRNAFPTSIGTMSMDASVGDATVINFPVTFSYTYFDVL